MVDLNGLLTAANTYNSRFSSPLQIAITEGNINTKNPADLTNGGFSSNSFIAGQFWAEMMASCMKNSVQFLNFWSIIEGNINLTPPDPEDKGYLRMVDASKRSTWFHFNFLANNFKGTYSAGTVTPSGTPYFCKAFGSYNSDQTAVLIMNQRATGSNYTYRIRLDGGSVSGSETEKINIPGPNLAIEYASTIDDESTTLLVFDSKGVLSSKTEYKRSDNLNPPSNACGTSLSMATQGSFDSYTPGIYSDITIGGGSAISLGSSNNSLYRAVNLITINGDFTVPLGQILYLLPTSCY